MHMTWQERGFEPAPCYDGEQKGSGMQGQHWTAESQCNTIK